MLSDLGSGQTKQVSKLNHNVSRINEKVFSSKHVDGKLDAEDSSNINPNFFHFTSRKDLVEQIQTVDPHGNDVEKVDEFSRWLLEQLEIWRIESAENEAKT